MKKIETSDLRQLNTNVASGTVTRAGTVTIMNAMAVGNGDGQRAGNRTVAKYLEMRIDVGLDGVALAFTTAMNYHYRCIVFWDKQANGAPPVISELLQNSGVGGNNYLSPFNFNGKSRYKVIWDKTVSLNPVSNSRQAIGTTTYDSMDKVIVLRKKLNTTTTYNNGNAGTVADISTNSLYMFETCSQDNNLVTASRCNLVYLE